MTNFESKRPYVFAKIQSDLRAKIRVRKIDVHVSAISHSCHGSNKHECGCRWEGVGGSVLGTHLQVLASCRWVGINVGLI